MQRNERDIPARKCRQISKGVILGTFAFVLPESDKKKRATIDKATHKWICILRAANGEDMSYFIKKVVFKLHDSFLDPTRMCDSPPYQVEECGWGEFDLLVTVHFVDSWEKPVEMYHSLRLYPPNGISPPMNQPVVNEIYDELVFQNPRDDFYEKLVQGPLGPPIPPSSKCTYPNLADHFSTYDEATELAPT
eukprot:Platyproteum_vivax@DN13966_c0_g1_i1.p1